MININTLYSINSELYHHGIKGQKWGETNGPPYPLDSNISTGKKLRKSALKEAKAGSKEYKKAKLEVKDLKRYTKSAKFNLQKTKEDEDATRKEKKIAKSDYKLAMSEYKEAKADLKRIKANSKASKEFLTSISDKKPSELAAFLEDNGWSTIAIEKLAMKDYKREQKKAKAI